MASEQSHKCPQCGYEYLSWVSVCPDCGTPIETRPQPEITKGKLNPNEDPHWTIVTNVPNAIIGKFMKDQIEDAGIPVLMFRSRSADVAQFSHNDFVPQDLMVPLDRVRDARMLIDSAPGDRYGLWEQPTSEAEEEIEPEGGEDFSTQATTDLQSDLPQGWQMLPTESDLSAHQEVRRSHGAALKGWYWSDETPSDETGFGPNNSTPGFSDADSYDDFGAYERRESYRSEEWSRPNKWVKLFYGVLLLAMSLPFLLQLTQHLLSIFGSRR